MTLASENGQCRAITNAPKASASTNCGKHEQRGLASFHEVSRGEWRLSNRHCKSA